MKQNCRVISAAIVGVMVLAMIFLPFTAFAEDAPGLKPPAGIAFAASNSVVIVTNCPSLSTEKDTLDKVNIGAAILSAIASLAAAIFAFLATIQARDAARQSQETATQTNLAAAQAEQTARDQRLVDLFADILKLTYLFPDEIASLDKATGEKVVANLNIMEKIAFSWEKNLVDRRAVEDQVRPFFIDLYDQIAGLPQISSLARNGQELVADCPKATELRRYLTTTPAPPKPGATP